MKSLSAPAQAAVRSCCAGSGKGKDGEATGDGLDPAGLRALGEALKAGGGPRLHEVMQGSKAMLPSEWYPPKKAERTPEQEKYLTDLRLKSEQRKYDSMISSVTAREREAADPTNFSGLKHASTQMAMAFNVIVAMATAFTVGYWIGKFNDLTQTQRLLLGLLFLVVTLFIEVILLIIYVYKHELDANTAVFKEAKQARRDGKSGSVGFNSPVVPPSSTERFGSLESKKES